jgi:protein O-GlcNAc transferase
VDLNQDQNLKIIFNLINAKEYKYAFEKLKDIQNNYQNNFEFFHFEGIVYTQLNELDEAIISFKKSVKLKPDFFLGYYNIGQIYLGRKNYLKAKEYYQKSININNIFYDANFKMGFVCRELREFSTSINFFKKCTRIKTNDIESFNFLGLNFLDLKFYDKSFENFKQCILIDKNFFEAYNHIGLIYAQLQKSDYAIFFFKKAITLKPSEVSSYYNLGNFYANIGNFYEAQSNLKDGIHKNPDSILLNLGLARIYFDFRNFIESEKILKKIKIILDVNKIKNSDNNLYIAMYYELLANLESLKLNPFRSLSLLKISYKYKPNAEILSKIIFAHLYLDYNFNKYFYFAKEYKNQLYKSNNYHQSTHTLEANNNIKKNSKIKIGFISSDLRDHAVGFQVYPVLKEISKKNDIQIFAYYNFSSQDKTNERFKKFFYAWNDIYNLSDLDVASLIKSQEIDILVDLNGHTKGSRHGVIVQKPAAIQIQWSGYLASVGLKEIDYIIVDKQVASSLTIKDEFVEKKLVMPNIWTVLEKNYVPKLSKAIPFKKNGFVTFGSFNNSRKINLEVIDLWSRILLNFPNSKLLLKNNEFEDPLYRENFKHFFKKKKINDNQLIFEGPSGRNTLLERYNDIDIVLDTYPYNGGTTNLEAAWMCVPILTLKGNKFISLCGASINFNLELHNWVASDKEEYYFKAIEFAKNVNYLQAIKDKLINNREKCFLFDSLKFSDHLYDSLKKIIGFKN